MRSCSLVVIAIGLTTIISCRNLIKSEKIEIVYRIPRYDLLLFPDSNDNSNYRDSLTGGGVLTVNIINNGKNGHVQIIDKGILIESGEIIGLKSKIIDTITVMNPITQESYFTFRQYIILLENGKWIIANNSYNEILDTVEFRMGMEIQNK